MKFSLQGSIQLTTIPPELIEIYQPVIGFEAVSVWINLYHALVNGYTVDEGDIMQQMNITQKSFKMSLKTLAKYRLLQGDSKEYIITPPTMAELLEQIQDNSFAYEQERRFITLIEAFRLKRGQALGNLEAATTSEQDSHQLTEQQADEFATRFIKECKFVPSRQLRDRFDMWFEQLQDRRLLEELLERTKRKVTMEGSKGTCPSRYADTIVRQWLVQGIKTYEDLLRLDQKFQASYEFYRAVEKELGRSYNTLTPAEKEIIDKWSTEVEGPVQLGNLIKKAILSGEYQGKGAPGIAFIDKWLESKDGKPKPKSVKSGKSGFTHEHKLSDLEKLVRRKTMVGLEGEDNEG